MQFDELRYVCQQAAIDVLGRQGRPVTPTVVLPGPDRTRLLALPELPAEDEARHTVFAQLAADHVSAESVPCWGFVAEAEVAGQDGVVVVYGARRHAPRLTAALFGDDDELTEFVAEEDLDPTAMPFLHPLQHAVDALPAAGDVFAEADPKRAGGTGLPLAPDHGPHH